MSSNGYFRDDELAWIDNGQRLVPAAAARYNAMRAAAAADGINIVTTEGYRDYQTQVYLYNLYGSPRASQPGYSPHGLGLAVDLNTDYFGGPVYDWLASHAGAFGFNNRVGIQIEEHWHWVYDGTGTAGTGGTPFPGEQGEEVVAMFRVKGIDFLVVPGLGFYKSPTPRITGMLTAAYGSSVVLNDGDWQADLNTVLWPAGVTEGWAAWDKAVTNVFVYNDATNSSLELTDAQIAKISAGIKVPAISAADIAKIVSGVDKELDDEQAAVLAAIAAIKTGDTGAVTAALAKVPEATVAAFKAAL